MYLRHLPFIQKLLTQHTQLHKIVGSTVLAAALISPGIVLAAPSKASQQNVAWSKKIQAGSYVLDTSHASLHFTVDHLGFSNYTGSFTSFEAKLELDPANPSLAQLNASVDVSSLTIPSPPDGFLNELLGAQWFNAKAFPTIKYTSKTIEQTGDKTAIVHGEITFLGKTLPLKLHVKFNGGYPGFEPYDPNARVGFSASGSLKRSDFGMTYGLPPKDSKMGVSDIVTMTIEAEFTGPPLPANK
ncbi:Protein YceI [Thalassocella blandensis]|nr:Protein YceI [Thalassocella blandensis]